MHLGADSCRHPPVSHILWPFEIRDNRSGERAQLLKVEAESCLFPFGNLHIFQFQSTPQAICTTLIKIHKFWSTWNVNSYRFHTSCKDVIDTNQCILNAILLMKDVVGKGAYTSEHCTLKEGWCKRNTRRDLQTPAKSHKVYKMAWKSQNYFEVFKVTLKPCKLTWFPCTPYGSTPHGLMWHPQLSKACRTCVG